MFVNICFCEYWLSKSFIVYIRCLLLHILYFFMEDGSQASLGNGISLLFLYRLWKSSWSAFVSQLYYMIFAYFFTIYFFFKHDVPIHLSPYSTLSATQPICKLFWLQVCVPYPSQWNTFVLRHPIYLNKKWLNDIMLLYTIPRV